MFNPETDYLDHIRKRLTQLRIQKNVSAREMSLSIGQNENYINRIENGNYLPSMQVFLYICEYLNVSPEEFFTDTETHPYELELFSQKLRFLKEDELHALDLLLDSITKRK